MTNTRKHGILSIKNVETAIDNRDAGASYMALSILLSRLMAILRDARFTHTFVPVRAKPRREEA